MCNKNYQQTRYRRELPPPDAVIYEKPTANVLVNSESLCVFSLRKQAGQDQLSLFLFHTVFEVLNSKKAREEKRK